MQVAEEARRAPVGADVGEHRRRRGLGEPLDRRRRRRPSSSSSRKNLPSRWKCAASSRASTVLGCVPAAIRIVRAGSVTRAYSCQTPSPSLCCSETSSAQARPSASMCDGERCQPFGEADPLLQRLADFLVIQRVGRAVDQPAAIGDRDAAPSLQQLGDTRGARRSRFAVARSARSARACARNSCAIARSSSSTRLRPPRALLRRERLVAREELLDLHRVIGERLGRRVDRRQAAADDDRPASAAACWRANPSWPRR